MEIKSTDLKDFKLIYNECYPLLMKICYHVVYNLDIAQDLVQETFERFYMKNMSFPSEDDAKYWLIRVSKNLALNHVRRNNREINMVEKVKQLPTTSATYVVDGVKELSDKETIKEVRAAIEMLPDNLKMVITLKEYGDLDYKAIGKILGISESNVKVRVHRARKKLEEILSKEDGYVY